MKRLFPIIAAALALASGCVTSDRDAAEAITALREGRVEDARKWGDELATDSVYSKNLGMVEAGRIRMLTSDIEGADGWFGKAIDSAIDRKEAQPTIKLGDVGNTVMASTITDDRTREYYLAPYELNLALEYKILCEEALNKRDEALVDARLAVYVQENLAETYGADVAKAAEEGEKDEKSKGVGTDQIATMDDVIASTRNSWENPVLWWLTGLLLETEGEPGSFDNAKQSYLRAAAIRPENPFFAADAARTKLSPARDKARVAIVFGEDLVSRRESLKVPVPIYTTISIDIPLYRDGAHTPWAVTVSADGKAPTAAAPGLNVQSLAFRDLKEHLPGVITRNVTRAALQVAAQAAANNCGNEYAQLAVLVGNTVITAVRRADTRSWITLPMSEQVWCKDDLEPGEHTFDVTANGVTTSLKLALKPGETKIVYVNNIGGTVK